MAKRLVVGLGNPGPEYEKTWHNLGFHVVREVAKRTRSGLKLSGDVLLATGKFAGTDLFLALPQTYMNLSGVPVARLMKQHQLHDDEVLVVFDDHDLPRGRCGYVHPGGWRTSRTTFYSTRVWNRCDSAFTYWHSG